MPRCPRWCASRRPHDYEQWRERNPDARPWIRGAAWHVPVRWFVLFDDDEREYTKSDQEPVLRYRTPMVQARRRVARGCARCGTPWKRGR